MGISYNDMNEDYKTIVPMALEKINGLLLFGGN